MQAEILNITNTQKGECKGWYTILRFNNDPENIIKMKITEASAKGLLRKIGQAKTINERVCAINKGKIIYEFK